MHITFKPILIREWTLTDDCIHVGSKTIQLSAVTNVRCMNKPTNNFNNGVIIVDYIGGSSMLAFPYRQLTDGEKAVEFIKEKAGIEELNKLAAELEAKEFRMRCNVCGKIFCYTIDDLRKNIENAKNAKNATIFGALNAVAGTEMGMYANLSRSDTLLNSIVDYSRCPNCNSSNISLIEEEIESQIKTTEQTSFSPADELRKYKELLDSGVITQEEFIAKKKQLLGL